MSPSSARNPNAGAKGVNHNHNHVQQAYSHSRRGQNIVSPSSNVGAQAANQIGNVGNGHIEGNNISRMAQPTPLFERLVTEEVQELKAYARIIENQNRRLAELERVHGDLESRLELESRGRVQLETTLEERERDWALKFKDLEADRDRLREVVKFEQTKNSRLRDQVVRKDQDIHRMLQRKYDNQREVPMSHSIRNVRPIGNERQTGSSQPTTDSAQRGAQHFKSPHEILAASGSMEKVRKKNAQNLLVDFFAL